MKANIQLGLAGHFTMTVHGGKRGRVVLAEFDNLILDAGLERLASGNTTVLNTCQVGTGTTAPAVGQTALVNKLAHTAFVSRDWSSGTYVAGPPAYKWDYKTFRFNTGVATGNLTEVGVGWGTTGSLFSRALILDGGGSPTSITVLSDETLDVTYTLRIYAPSDVTGSITLAGTSHSFTMRGAAMSSGGTGTWRPGDLVTFGFANSASPSVVVYSGSISATPGGVPSGTSGTDTITGVVSAYVANSYQRDVQYSWSLSQGNIGGGIKSIHLYVAGSAGFSTHAYQAEFAPNIPKDATKNLKLNFTFSLARAP